MARSSKYLLKGRNIEIFVSKKCASMQAARTRQVDFTFSNPANVRRAAILPFNLRQNVGGNEIRQSEPRALPFSLCEALPDVILG